MKKIIHVFHVKSSLHTVQAALSTKKGLGGWWTTDVKMNDGNAGSTITFTFGDTFQAEMKILKADTTSIAWTCTGAADLWIGGRFSFELAENNDMTQVKFIQEYVKDITEEDYGIYNFNWGYYLNSLKQLCETGVGKPFGGSSD